MLKFITVQLVDDEDVKGMIYVIRQYESLQCSELYANIKLHIIPTPNPQPISHEPQYYSNPQSHVSHTSNVTQATFYLIQPQEILFEPNTSSFTQLISASFSTNLLDS